MSPDEARMLCALLQASRGAPGYGESHLRGLAVDDSYLVLDLQHVSSSRPVRLRIPFTEMTMMNGLTFEDDPAQYGTWLALFLDEEVGTGLLSRGVPPPGHPHVITLDADGW